MYYIGIDLGTTNSAISIFDGRETRVCKSPEQNDVTPSVIYVNKRGGKMYGQSAYNNMARDPKNTASGFKRLMGTNTKISLDCGVTMTPEECSTELLKTLYGYLPEEISEDKDTSVVITVPAAFNQMQKNATSEAAYDAHIRNVWLVQEPVAAISKVALLHKVEGTFLVYDYGGGTFDVSIAQCTANKPNLLSTGGISYCGGRDIDKAILENIVMPWLMDHFELPENIKTDDKYSKLIRIASWATERAKIELSSKKNSVVHLEDLDVQCTDEAGTEIYLDVPISRAQYEELLFPKVDATIDKARELIKEAGLDAGDFNCIVFIGGPTMYKPLRDYVSEKLGIEPNTDANPMTAVSEGAAIYAESVNFESGDGEQKGDVTLSRSVEHNLSLRYNSRTSADKASIGVRFEGADTLDFVFTCTDTGWNSGVLTLKDGSMVKVDLFNPGANHFAVQCMEKGGTHVEIDEPRFVITKTAVTVGRIPNPHSIGVEIEDSITHEPKLDYLIRRNELLPKTGKTTYRTTTRIKAGNIEDSISLKLWEGEYEDAVGYDRFIGEISIDGTAFDAGVINIGDLVECEYSFNNGGVLNISVKIPSVGILVKKDNFYNRKSGGIDLNDSDKVIEEAQVIYDKIEELNSSNYDEELDKAYNDLGEAMGKPDMDISDLQELSELTQSTKGVIVDFMRKNKQTLWQQRLGEELDNFSDYESKATDAQRKQVKILERSINDAIAANSSKAEEYLNQLSRITSDLMFSDDETFKQIFYYMASNPNEFTNSTLYNQYVNEGTLSLIRDDIDELKVVIGKLIGIRKEQKNTDLDNMIKRSGITK